MALFNFAKEKMENLVLKEATAYVESNPDASMEIGELFQQQFPLLEANTVDEILIELSHIAAIAKVDRSHIDNTWQRHIDAGHRRKVNGDKSGMYAFNIMAALFRAAGEASTGQPKACARFGEIAAMVATSLATYRKMHDLGINSPPPSETEQQTDLERLTSTAQKEAVPLSQTTPEPSKEYLELDENVHSMSTLIECPNCNTKLPMTSGGLDTIRCPKCSNAFEAKT